MRRGGTVPLFLGETLASSGEPGMQRFTADLGSKNISRQNWGFRIYKVIESNRIKQKRCLVCLCPIPPHWRWSMQLKLGFISPSKNLHRTWSDLQGLPCRFWSVLYSSVCVLCRYSWLVHTFPGWGYLATLNCLWMSVCVGPCSVVELKTGLGLGGIFSQSCLGIGPGRCGVFDQDLASNTIAQ